VPEEDIQHEPLGGGSRGGGVTLILSVGEGRLKLVFA